MVDRRSDDWLPAGWTVEVKVRSNGRKDKCYFDPSGGFKFNSRPEVFRYLKTVQISCPNFEQQKKDTRNQSAKSVVAQKVVAEGLPPGWIKEIKETKKAGKIIRRDPFYTDPASGYVFRSMKDALRYLKTGELGKFAFKPKDIKPKDIPCNRVEFEEDKIPSPPAAKKQKLSVSGTRKQISGDQSSKTNAIVNDEKMLESGGTRDSTLHAEQTSGHCKLGAESGILNLPEARRTSDHIKGHSDSTNGGLVSAPATRVLTEKQPLENEMNSHEIKNTQCGLQSKGRKASNLPRRSSKRLAGLELDPVPELKTSRRAGRVALKSGEAETCKAEVSEPDSLAHPIPELKSSSCALRVARKSGEAETCKAEASESDSFSHPGTQLLCQLEDEQEAKCIIGTAKIPKVQPLSNSSKHLFSDLATPEVYAGKVETESKNDEKQECSVTFPRVNLAIAEDNNKADEKPEFSLDLPLKEILSDPCIEFAIKTLTGVAFDTSEITEVLMRSSSSEHPSRDLVTLATPEKHGGKVDKEKGDNVVLPLEDRAIPEEQSKLVGTDGKSNEKSGPRLDTPFGDFWTDPCIEFAVKTLTGGLPVENDMDTHDCFHSQLSSSHTQGSSDLTLSNVGLDNFCQTDILSQHFSAVDKPALPHTRTVNLRSTSGLGLHHHNEEQRNYWQRYCTAYRKAP